MLRERLLASQEKEAQAYYDGHLPVAPDIRGRSSVVSTDVADSVEWILPSIVENLSGKAVKFRPMSAQDEMQAELETDFTHFVFSEDNNGYLALYSAAKDALMSGTGIIKVQYDDTPERVVERYDGLQEPQLQALLADPMLEVTEIGVVRLTELLSRRHGSSSRAGLSWSASPLKSFAYATLMTVATLKTVDLSRTLDVGLRQTYSQRATILRSSRTPKTATWIRVKHLQLCRPRGGREPEADRRDRGLHPSGHQRGRHRRAVQGHGHRRVDTDRHPRHRGGR